VCVSTGVNAHPVVLESKRVSPSSVFVSWGPYEGLNTFVVQYGFSNGDWTYNTTVTSFSATINELPPNRPIWVRVAATDNCAVGNYSEAVLVGSPRLPNTGVSQKQNFSRNHFSDHDFLDALSILRYWFF